MTDIKKMTVDELINKQYTLGKDARTKINKKPASTIINIKDNNKSRRMSISKDSSSNTKYEHEKEKEYKFIILNGIGPKKMNLEFLSSYFNIKHFDSYMINKTYEQLLKESEMIVFDATDKTIITYYETIKTKLNNSNYNVFSVYIHPSGKTINMDAVKERTKCNFVIKKKFKERITNRESAIKNLFTDHISSKEIKKSQKIMNVK